MAHLVSSKFPQIQIAQVRDVQLSDEGRASQRPTFVTRQSETSTWLGFEESTGFCLHKTRRKKQVSDVKVLNSELVCIWMRAPY